MTRDRRGAPRSAPPVLFLALLAAVPAAAGDPYAGELLARAREARLWEEPAWLALGHYRRAGGGWESEADGPGFFLSAGGKRDPSAELEATLLAFFEEEPAGERDQHALCRFPARAHWLSGRLGAAGGRLPAADCSRFEAWRKAIDAHGATLVFASAYLGNPGSMYGHTFLRLRRRGALPGEALLDYTVNFAGEADTANGLLYAVEGIFGFFPGRYSTLPYDMKIVEYTDMESRDLWEYDLSLDQERVDQLVRHAWEMGSTHFDYYFFSENCSYQLLTLLDAAEPSLRLAEGFRAWVIPADTVRAVLSREGLVSAVRHRPSLLSQLRARRALLSGPERRLAGRLGAGRLDGLAELQGLGPERRARVLDSAYDLLSFRSAGAKKDGRAAAGGRRLLVERGRLELPSEPVRVEAPAPPHQAHGSTRLGLGFGAGRGGPFIEADFRGAIHDLAGSPAGYPPDSELEMGDFHLRGRPKDGEVWIEKLDAVSIISISPWDSWTRSPSWRVSGGVDQAKELGCSGASCMHADLAGGAGAAFRAEVPGRPLGFLLALSDLGLGPVFRRNWRLGAGGAAGLLLSAGTAWRLQAEAAYIHYPQSEDRRSLRVTQSLTLGRDLELRMHFERRQPDREAGGALYWHF